MNEEQVDRWMAMIREMLETPGVEVTLEAGHRDVTGPGDTYRHIEPDGSRRIVIEVPPEGER